MPSMKRLVTSAAVAIAAATLIATLTAQTKKPAAAAAVAHKAPAQTASKGFTVVEATIPEMQAALKAGRVTSREIVTQYLQRIGMYEDKLHAAITVNPERAGGGRRARRERAAGKIRGPLHGIPIALKDNIHTTTCRPPAARSRSRTDAAVRSDAGEESDATPARSSSPRPG